MIRVRVSSAGVQAILKSSQVASMVHGKAEEVAAAANAGLASVGHPEMSAVVEDYVTDRAASGVVILHAGAAGVQAKYGVLSNAAGSAGLELRSATNV